MLWEAFTPHVAVEVKGAPLALIESELRRASIDLCRRAQPWVGEIAPTTININQPRYNLLPVAEDAAVSEVYSIWIDGRHIQSLPLSQMRRFGANWMSLSGEVTGYVQLDEGNVTLFRRPEVGGTLTGLAALVPSPNSKGVPDWLGSKFFDWIVAGAKARLFSMLATSWGNSDSATYYAAIFDGASASVAARRLNQKNRGADASPSQTEQA